MRRDLLDWSTETTCAGATRPHDRLGAARHAAAPAARRPQVLLAVVTALALAAMPASRAGAQQKVNLRHAATGDVYVRLTGSVGTLRIVGWDRDSVVLTGTLPAGMRMDGGAGGDGRAPTRGVKLYFESANDAASSAATLELRVPRTGRVWVKSGTANIEARDVTGGLDLNVIGGSIQVSASPRELQIEAMDAAVVIDGSPAWLRAKTAAGDITLRGGSADLALTSVSGGLRVEGGAVERARLETVTGAIRFAATPAGAGTLDFDSHSGTIDLLLAPVDGFTLVASSITGEVVNRFDRTRPVAGREGRGAELVLEAGTASARMTARTFKGTITVRR